MDEEQKILSEERLAELLEQHDMPTYIRLRAEEMIELMTQKNAQYGDAGDGFHDNLANFRAGANLKYGNADYPSMFEESKNFCRKHIAHVYGPNQDINAEKLKESLGDIIVYSFIQMYMVDQHEFEIQKLIENIKNGNI